LREKYKSAQAELSRQKQEALKNIERRAEEKGQKELQLEHEADRLRTELQFKERELAELQGKLMCEVVIFTVKYVLLKLPFIIL
jgi:hypothetical protein